MIGIYAADKLSLNERCFSNKKRILSKRYVFLLVSSERTQLNIIEKLKTTWLEIGDMVWYNVTNINRISNKVDVGNHRPPFIV